MTYLKGSLSRCVEIKRWGVSKRSNETSWEAIAVTQRRDNFGSASLAVGEGVRSGWILVVF